jgi:hypothetical protein
MKALFQETLQLMGAEVKESPRNELHVRVPQNSQASCLLGGRSEHRLSFSSENKKNNAILVAPGSALLEAAVLELAKTGAVRHGVLPILVTRSRKTLKNNYSVFAGTCKNFSSKRAWNTTVRLWVKAILSGDEVVEILEGVEIKPDRQPRRIDNAMLPGEDVQWVGNPPLKRYQLTALIKSSFWFAQNLIIDRAEELQTKKFRRLYKTLEKMRIYYHQIKEETLKTGNEEAVSAIEAEYQRRKQEELQYARVKVVVKIIAVETISTPVQELRWQLARNGNRKSVKAALNLYNGETISPVRCNICEGKTRSFGISQSGIVVCADCYIVCEFCGNETIGEHVSADRSCSICGRKVCEEHGLHCETCGELVCKDHQVKCHEGCHICSNCVQICTECGNNETWCKNHTTINSKGDVFCQKHAAFCVGCRGYYPTQKVETCDACGQTVCRSCRERCRICKKIFCLNHIENGECKTCRTHSSQMKLF